MLAFSISFWYLAEANFKSASALAELFMIMFMKKLQSASWSSKKTDILLKQFTQF